MNADTNLPADVAARKLHVVCVCVCGVGGMAALEDMVMWVVLPRLIPSVFLFCKSRSFSRFTDHLLIAPKSQSDAFLWIFDSGSEAPPPLLLAAGTSDQTKFVEAAGTSAPYHCVVMNQQNTLRLVAAEDTKEPEGLTYFHRGIFFLLLLFFAKGTVLLFWKGHAVIIFKG